MFQACSQPSPCLCPRHLPICQHSAPVFYLRVAGWVSNLQTLGTQCGVDPHWSSGGGSHHTLAGAGLPQMGSHRNAQQLEVYGNTHQNLSSRLAALNKCLYPYAMGWGNTIWELLALLFPKMQSNRSQMHSKSWETALPVHPLIMKLLPGLCPSSYENWLHSSTVHVGYGQQTLRWWIKGLITSNTLVGERKGLGIRRSIGESPWVKLCLGFHYEFN